mgnify:CR=1 FL=1
MTSHVSVSTDSLPCAAATIGPTVCELDGPMPILKRLKTLMLMGVQASRGPR